MKDPNGILMIEPMTPASDEPVIDELTRKITAAFRRSTEGEYGYRGFHRCICGEISDNQDHFIGGVLTNSLCIHYMAYHRDAVPIEEIRKVQDLNHGEENPTHIELHHPRRQDKNKARPNAMRGQR